MAIDLRQDERLSTADRPMPAAAAAVPKVVVIGAGFGGLEATMALRRAPVDVTVIDRQNYHCFQPLLYQVATASLSPADVAWAIRHILRHQRNATVIMAEVTGIDTAARIVRTRETDVPYDYLVIATGATHSYFGHDEWAKVAHGLKRIEDALLIRREFLIAFEEAEVTEDENKRQQLLTFVVVGGGPTGVEMAGALADIARQTLPPDFRRIDPRTARILLIEAGPRILPTFPEDLADYTRKALERMGVEVMTSTRVVNCHPGGVDLENGAIEASTIVWAAGVVASPAATWLYAERDRAGRVIVGPDLSVPGHPEIFVVGDAAAATDQEGKALPGLAPAAKQMGRYAGRRIAAAITRQKPPGPFRYRHQGDLATIGRHAAVVKLRRFHLTGYLGWLFWSVAHIYFLIGVRNRFLVAFTWLWDDLTLQRGARLITDLRAPWDATSSSRPERSGEPGSHEEKSALSENGPGSRPARPG